MRKKCQEVRRGRHAGRPTTSLTLNAGIAYTQRAGAKSEDCQRKLDFVNQIFCRENSLQEHGRALRELHNLIEHSKHGSDEGYRKPQAQFQAQAPHRAAGLSKTHIN